MISDDNALGPSTPASANAYAPEFVNAGSGEYEAVKTGKKVYVKRIDVKKCLELIKKNGSKYENTWKNGKLIEPRLKNK